MAKAGLKLRTLVKSSRPPATSSSITQRTVTLTFDGPVDFVTNFRGDTFIKGPVTLIGYTPAANGSGINARNGAMINPTSNLNQGYDGRYTGRGDGVTYSDSFNMGIGLPRTLNPGDSLIVTTSRDPTNPSPSFITNASALDYAEIFTIVSTLPPVNAFRPPYYGTNKPIYTTDDIQTGLLGVYASPINPFTAGPIIDVTSSPAVSLAETQLDQVHGSQSSYCAFIPAQQSEFYPAYRGGNAIRQMAYSMCNFSDRLQYTYNVIQMGIDYRWQSAAGRRFKGGAGFGGSRGIIALYAGKLLGNPDVLGTPWLTLNGNEQDIDPTYGWPMTKEDSIWWPEQASHYYSPNPYAGYVFPASYNPAGKGGFANAWPLYGDNQDNGVSSMAQNHSDRDPIGQYNGVGPNSRYQSYDASNQYNNIGPAGGYMHCCSNRYWSIGTIVLRMLGIHTNLNSPALLDFLDWWAADDNLSLAARVTWPSGAVIDLNDSNRDIRKFNGSGNLFMKTFWEANR